MSQDPNLWEAPGVRVYADFENEVFYVEAHKDASFPARVAAYLKAESLGLELLDEDEAPAEETDDWLRVWCAEKDGGASRGL